MRTLVNELAEIWTSRFPRPAIEQVAAAAGFPIRSGARRRVTRSIARDIARNTLAGHVPSAMGHGSVLTRELVRALLAESANASSTALRSTLETARRQARNLAPPPPVTGQGVGAPPSASVPVLVDSIAGPLAPGRLVQRPQVLPREAEAAVEIERVLEETRRQRLWMPSDWRRPPARTVARFDTVLEGPASQVDSFRARIWPVLLVACGVVERQSPQCLTLGTLGHQMMATAPNNALHMLFDQWRRAQAFDELSSVRHWIGEDSVPQPGARHVVPPAMRRLQILAAVRCLPVGQWVAVSALARHAAEHGLLPVVASNLDYYVYTTTTWLPTRLPADHPEGQPFVLGVPCLMQALTEILATLGVVDIAWAPRGSGVIRQKRWRMRSDHRRVIALYSRLSHVRLTPRGARFLDPDNRPTDDAREEQRVGRGKLDALADLLAETATSVKA